MWITGGSPSLSGSSGNYTVNMGTATINLEVELGPGGSEGDLKATLNLANLFGGISHNPLLSGSFDTSTLTRRRAAASSVLLDLDDRWNGSPDIASGAPI
jgi:hypothetical protein